MHIGAFRFNNLLTKLEIPAQITSIKSYSLDGYYTTKHPIEITFEKGSKITEEWADYYLSYFNLGALFTITDSITTLNNDVMYSSTVDLLYIPDSVTSISNGAFVPGAILAKKYSIPAKFNKGVVDYGFTQSQWDNDIIWRGSINITDEIGTTIKFSGFENKNITAINLEKQLVNNPSSFANLLAFEFAIGVSTSNLTINWTAGDNFQTTINNFYTTGEITIKELNIFVRLVLIDGTGANQDMIGDNQYFWNKDSVQIYSQAKGAILEYVVSGAGIFLRAYSKIDNTWANPLSAGGKLASDVQILNENELFDLNYYSLRGIQLEVNPTSDDTSWVVVTAFNTSSFDASGTNHMKFRLSVIDSLRYEIYGLPVLDPLGNKTDVITKKVDSLKKLNGIMVIDLIPVLTGSSFNLIINEPNSLYAVDGMTVVEFL